jgi:hypothetical protein
MIPATAHFIWYSAGFHWLHAAAIRSAVDHGGFARVVLHHDTPLRGRPGWSLLEGLAGFEARPMAPEETFARCGNLGEDLGRVYAALQAPAARANVLRAAILFAEGGVYLDTDTVTVGDLDALRAPGGAFVGLEHVVYPRALLATRRPVPMAGALCRDLVRDVCRRLPDGWRAFRRMARRYPQAANNAVLGAQAGHPLVGALLAGMVATPAARRTVRYALGTHLLQETLAGFVDDPTVTVLPPEVFYPLGPEISEHWFRPARRLDLAAMVPPQTRVVHWYASVRTAARVPAIDAAWVEACADRVPLAALLRQTGLTRGRAADLPVSGPRGDR